MRALLSALAHRPDPTFRDADWLARLGPVRLEGLRNRDLLEDGLRATYYPCDATDSHGCSRKVMAHPLPGQAQPFIACCREDDDPGCETLDLTAKQLEASRFRSEAFFALLQKLLGMAPVPVVREPALVDTYRLGTVGWAGLQRRVFATWTRGETALGAFLQRQPATDGPALVFVPNSASLPTALRETYPAHALVALVDLERVLSFEGGTFSLTGFARSQLTATTLARPGPEQEHYCWAMVDGRPSEPITHERYLELVAKSKEYNLVINLMAAKPRGSRICGRRWGSGRPKEILTPPLHAQVLAEVMVARGGLLLRQFRNAGNRTATTFHEARKMVDRRLVNLPEKPWEAFQVLPGDVETGFQFSPPEGYRSLLLHNLTGRARGLA
jgi:hypothetical protein